MDEFERADSEFVSLGSLCAGMARRSSGIQGVMRSRRYDNFLFLIFHLTISAYYYYSSFVSNDIMYDMPAFFFFSRIKTGHLAGGGTCAS